MNQSSGFMEREEFLQMEKDIPPDEDGLETELFNATAKKPIFRHLKQELIQAVWKILTDDFKHIKKYGIV
ncbi:hypothetical protein C0995_004836 [Termitomyces sp. Mi166|nr:hypothetical protein C0995_004836 [Termitomyces sp. Mi166\